MHGIDIQWDCFSDYYQFCYLVEPVWTLLSSLSFCVCLLLNSHSLESSFCTREVTLFFLTSIYTFLNYHILDILQYADPVSDLLDIHHSLSGRLFREHCVYHRGNYVKVRGVGPRRYYSILHHGISSCCNA